MEQNGNKSGQVAQRILTHLNDQGLSQRWLAEQTSIPLATLNRRVQGRTSFTIEELYSVASALDTSVAELVTVEVQA
jgi:transcriptional regulator with XRE-family HTH domain